jgi:hypothetical protein
MTLPAERIHRLSRSPRAQVSTLKMTWKASCGISTLPTAYMRFLPCATPSPPLVSLSHLRHPARAGRKWGDDLLNALCRWFRLAPEQARTRRTRPNGPARRAPSSRPRRPVRDRPRGRRPGRSRLRREGARRGRAWGSSRCGRGRRERRAARRSRLTICSNAEASVKSVRAMAFSEPPSLMSFGLARSGSSAMARMSIASSRETSAGSPRMRHVARVVRGTPSSSRATSLGSITASRLRRGS